MKTSTATVNAIHVASNLWSRVAIAGSMCLFFKSYKIIKSMHVAVVCVLAGVIGISGMFLLLARVQMRNRGVMMPITYMGYRYTIVSNTDTTSLMKLHQLRLHAFQLGKNLTTSHPYLAHRLTRRLQRSILSDRAAKLENKHVAYTINKGDEIVMCLQPPNQPCVLNYVFLHELAHVITKAVGHPPIFYSNLDLLTKAAVEEKICVPAKQSNATYCNHHVQIV